MPNSYTQVTRTGFGGRIGKSIGGVFFGLLLFVASFVVLYLNEGRVDLSKIAQTATPVSYQSVASDQNGNLVAITGPVSSAQTLGDNLFLKPGNYVAANREVQTYAWVETKSTQTTNNTGGSQTTNTTYNYNEEWVPIVTDSANFAYPAGHQNPQSGVPSQTFEVSSMNVGVYNIDPSVKLSYSQTLPLSATNILQTNQVTAINGDALYIPSGATSTLQNPQIGDQQVSYRVLPDQATVTVFGKLDGQNITSYYDNSGHELFLMYPGSRDDAINSLHTQYTIWLWVVRGIGFLMMWFGLGMLFGPILTILSILPILEDVAGIAVFAATFVIALIITIVTILISIIAHNIIALLIAVVVTIIILILFGFYLHRRKMSRKNMSTGGGVMS